MRKKIEWIKTRHVGVRYFKHSDRKHGIQFDKSFQSALMAPAVNFINHPLDGAVKE